MNKKRSSQKKLFLSLALLTTLLLFSTGAISTSDSRSEDPVLSFTRLPYPQSTDSGNATICWATSEAVTGKLLWGENSQLTETLSLDISLKRQEARITGLDPNTTYSYRVEAGALDSGLRSFTAAPDMDGGFSFLVVGDTQTNHDTHARIVNLMANENAPLHIHTGILETWWKMGIIRRTGTCSSRPMSPCWIIRQFIPPRETMTIMALHITIRWFFPIMRRGIPLPGAIVISSVWIRIRR